MKLKKKGQFWIVVWSFRPIVCLKSKETKKIIMIIIK